MREAALWASLRRALPQVHWQRIEGSPGVPDMNGCFRGTEFWIEGKIVRAGSHVRFQKGQVAWLVRRALAGGRAFVLVALPNSGNAWQVYSAMDAMELASDGTALAPLATFCPPRDYAALLRLLVGA